jgi:hypothetical protein
MQVPLEQLLGHKSRKARSRSLLLSNPRLYINRSSAQLPAHTSRQFATNHLWALALGGFAHAILEHTAAPISES